MYFYKKCNSQEKQKSAQKNKMITVQNAQKIEEKNSLSKKLTFQ